MQRIRWAILSLAFASLAQGQSSDIFSVRDERLHEANYFVTFGELVANSGKLAGKLIDISGFCSVLDKSDRRPFLFATKEAWQQLEMRNSAALKFSDKESEFSREIYISTLRRVGNAPCRVYGRYELDFEKLYGIPSRGTINVILVTGGIGPH